MHEVSGHPVVGRKVVDFKALSPIIELRRVAHRTIAGQLKPAIESIQEIERLSGKFEFPTIL